MKQYKDIQTTNKRVLVTFTPEQWKLIETVKGEFGRADADAVRTIVISWLIEKGFIDKALMDKNLGQTIQGRESNEQKHS